MRFSALINGYSHQLITVAKLGGVAGSHVNIAILNK